MAIKCGTTGLVMVVFGLAAHYLAIGGVENSIRSMLATLQPEEQAIVVCHRARPGETMSEAKPLPDNVRVIEYKADKIFNKTLNRIYGVIAREHPSAVVIGRQHQHILAAAKAGLKNVYMVPSIISHQVQQELTGHLSVSQMRLRVFGVLHQYLQRQAFNHAGSLCAFSDSMQRQIVAEQHHDLSLSDIKRVRPGIDKSRFSYVSLPEKQNIRRELGLPEEKILLLSVGRLVKGKGVDLAILALPHLSDMYHLIVVGDGYFSQSLLDLAKTHKVDHRITWMGARADVERFYRSSDIFLMTSLYECFGQTIIEATGSGLPVVAFAKSEKVDTATHELGLDDAIAYCNVEQPSSLALAAANIDRSFEYSKSISEKTHALYDWRRLLDDLKANASK